MGWSGAWRTVPEPGGHLVKRIEWTDENRNARRRFLKQGLALAAGATAFPYVVPGKALGLDGATAPSERITLGCLGTGSMGTGNMKGFLQLRDCQVVAVCDVDRKHREDARVVVNEAYGSQDCAVFHDFRDLLERTDIDALSIALPDHWHSIPVVMAARKGFHMYAEKPLALTIYEGQVMVEEVEESGVVWQTGSWQRSRPHFRQACELVRNGYIGKVHRVEVGLPTGHRIDPQPEMPVPEGFDYDFWLGPAPAVPYTEKRCHWNFRWILDYSGGQLTDWAAHHVDIANWGMGTEHTGPVRVYGTGDFPRTGLYDAAVDYRVVCEYGPGASALAPDGFEMILSNDFPSASRFIGEEGEIIVSREKMEATPESLAKIKLGPNDTPLYRSRSHSRNFLDCVRSGEETITPIGPAHRAISNAHLGNIAMLLERPIHWDPVAEAFPNDPQATRMLKRAMRAPWTL